MFFYIGLALLVLGSLGVMLSPDETTWFDRFLWIPAFWFGYALIAGAVFAQIFWGYWR